MMSKEHVISIFLPSLGEIRLGDFGLLVIYRIVYFGVVFGMVFQKALIPVRTYFQTRFSWKCWTWNLYTKIMRLCVTWSYNIQNPDTSQKERQFVSRFYIAKGWHFPVRNFSWNFWNWRRGGTFYKPNIFHSSLTFYVLKKTQFELRF